ncbi:hypothetical protein PHLCEN_2v6301, partial [Hermanssonia centrifuga]
IEDFHEPQAIYTAGATHFVKNILRMEPATLTMKFESNVVSTVGTEARLPGASVRFNKTQTVSNARSYVQEGFSTLFRQKHIDSSHQVTGSVDMILRRKDVHIIRKGKEKEIKMNYDNYEAKIVERYGVALVGYPCRLVNPANLGRTDLEKVVAAFKDGTCRWEKLSTSQLDARIKRNRARQAAGEEVYKARKVKSRKEKGNPKSAETINSDDDEDTEGDHNQALDIYQSILLIPEATE